jgi:hypothetical protein
MAIPGVGYDRAHSTTADTSSGPSDSIWGTCPTSEILANPGRGYHVFERFLQPPVLVTPTITSEANYGAGLKAFGQTGGTILSTAGASTGRGGGLVLLTDGTDNDAVTIAQIALPFQIIQGGGDVFLEARWKVKTIAANAQGIFCGLIEQQTLTGTVPIADAGTMADANFVGFLKNEAAATVNATYKANGVTAVVIKSSAATLVADTYLKTGFYYNDTAKILRMYCNGLQVGSDYTLATAAGTDFPNDVPLGFCLAMKNGSGASANDTCTLNWYRAAQVTPT